MTKRRSTSGANPDAIPACFMDLVNGDCPRLQAGLFITLAGRGKMRVDAQRNRDLLLQHAREAFRRAGAEASLDDIAKKAGVGSATLYRHFPTREALIEAVYDQEVQELRIVGERLITSESPVEALRRWLLTFADHVVEKHLIASALNESAYASARLVIFGTMQRLTQRAIDSGDLRRDTVAVDLLKALIGVLHTARDADSQAGAKRLIDLMLRGAAAGST